MLSRRRIPALFLAAWALSDPSAAAAEPAGGAASTDQTTPIVPTQVTYHFAVSTSGISVETAASPYDVQFGKVTLACLDRGSVAIVGRDARNVVVYEAVIPAAPKDDLALRPYSRAFSELRRIAWNICAPSQSVAHGESRTVEQKGRFALGGFTFPDEIKIKDQLGSVGCKTAASDKLRRAPPCKSNTLPQPFISVLTRRDSR